ncbi:unnamed protein product [Rotaria magnacalcarata]|uniref:Uncharacterized protein n=2 Tax=Rotaria magnacalcarata TaxID=392030 RepID=A0A816WYP7_9BILA|nr:unnamed protein product [Rotaria magnacalcarata]CAF4012970.1 unnamed protein product [Rotaria magnacalcarata]
MLSFKAARLLATFEQHMPSYLVPKRTSHNMQERNEFARTLIQHELEESYTSEQILYWRNIINSNDISKLEMGNYIDLDGAINRFKFSYPDHFYIRVLNILSLVPFRTQCNNVRNGIECGDQLRLDFYMTGFIINPTMIQPCTMYTADCKKCQRSYRVSSIYCMNEKKFVITSEALNNIKYFYLSSGKLVYSREFLVSFSADLVNGHISFNSASTSLLCKIARLQPGLHKKLNAIELSRSL